MSFKKSEEVFIRLLKGSVVGMTKYRTFEVLNDKEWAEVHRLAEVQGMTPVLISEIDKLPKECLPPMDMLMDWFGQAANRETTYQRQMELSCIFADAMAHEGVQCLVLKGLAVGAYYPVNKSRSFGDLDCFLVKDGDVAFSVGNEIARQKGAKVKKSGYKHTHIYLKSLLVENHEYLTNFAETVQGRRTEKILRGLALKGGYKRIDETNLWIPWPEFNVLFLLKHSLGDFLANDMTVKAVYDWAVFMRAEQKNVDWKRMEQLLDECKLHAFYDLMTEAAMTYLGLELYSTTLSVTSNSKMAAWLMNDVLDVPIAKKKSAYVVIRRCVDRVKRMIKYHRITTERIRTSLWVSFWYRVNGNKMVYLD